MSLQGNDFPCLVREKPLEKVSDEDSDEGFDKHSGKLYHQDKSKKVGVDYGSDDEEIKDILANEETEKVSDCNERRSPWKTTSSRNNVALNGIRAKSPLLDEKNQQFPSYDNFSQESSEVEDFIETDDEDEFFEGVEKLLEIWFLPGDQEDAGDLRSIPRSCLEELLKEAKCEIISTTKNSKIDAYLLSESSMFIAKRRFLLKTCGTTTPLDCLERLIYLVEKFTGLSKIEDIFYSRKNYTKPELQHSPHKNFEQEVNRLDEVFKDGSAYCMGTMNKDCWYIYTLNPMDHYIHGRPITEDDQTLEILMSDLDEKKMDIFYKKNSKSAKEATKISGISDIVPEMKIDDFLFDPCGYSMNGVLENGTADSGSGEYVSIHITPELAYSYVSFETNMPKTDYMAMVKKVLDAFCPGKFVLTFYATRRSVSSSFHQELKKAFRISDWRRNDIQFCSFQDCDLTYSHFFKPSS